MAIQKILLPYNFTAYDQKSLDFTIQTFAHRRDLAITLFNAYTPVPEIEMRESPVMEKLRGNLGYLSQRIMEQEAGLKEAQQRLLQNGFLEGQVRYIFKPRKKDIASEIIDLVLNDKYDLIIVNRKPGKATRFFTSSVFNKVVTALKDATVCIVS
ncbi:MAG: universal stress protein [Desulfobacterales bacterium]|nr:MAG: universal stress protein [Desulfobacterales bacterium]